MRLEHLTAEYVQAALEILKEVPPGKALSMARRTDGLNPYAIDYREGPSDAPVTLRVTANRNEVGVLVYTLSVASSRLTDESLRPIVEVFTYAFGRPPDFDDGRSPVASFEGEIHIYRWVGAFAAPSEELSGRS